MIALPFCHFRFKVSKNQYDNRYPKELNTLGDHLRKRRLDLDLLQKEVAHLLKVDKATVYNWENRCFKPEIRHIPRIISFLTYCPYFGPKTFFERVVEYRQTRGISQKELAQKIRVDPSTLASWEKGDRKPVKKSLKVLEKILEFKV